MGFVVQKDGSNLTGELATLGAERPAGLLAPESQMLRFRGVDNGLLLHLRELILGEEFFASMLESGKTPTFASKKLLFPL